MRENTDVVHTFAHTQMLKTQGLLSQTMNKLVGCLPILIPPLLDPPSTPALTHLIITHFQLPRL